MAKTIAVAAGGPSLDSMIDPSFDDSKYFIFIDPETMDFTVETNPATKALWGAGIKAAEFVIWHGVSKIITSSIGQFAKSILVSEGIDVITGVIGIVRDAVQNYMIKAPESAATKKHQPYYHKSYGTY